MKISGGKGGRRSGQAAARLVKRVGAEVEANFRAWLTRNFVDPRAGRIGGMSYSRAGSLDDRVGDGLWYQGVRLSKRSPKKGLVAPEGATAAFIEVLKAHETDACEVAELVLEPFKERVEK